MQSNFVRGALLCLGLALTGSAVAQQLDNVTVAKNGADVTVQITGSGLKQPKEIWSKQTGVYTLHFAAALKGKARFKSVNSGGLKSVSYGWFDNKPPTVRVTFKLSVKNVKPTFEQTEDGWAVHFGGKSAPTSVKENKTLPSEKSSAPKTSTADVPPYPKTQTFSEPKDPKPSQLLALDSKSAMAGGARVSLDFVNTDLVQIIKALALQSGVNIVTAPEVKGQLSVSLDNVSVKDALDLVTTLAGLRYKLVGNTYLVTTSGKFYETMRAIDSKTPDLARVSRVVSISSGEGLQVKVAVMKAVPDQTLGGSYEIMLPSESVEVTSAQTNVNNKDDKNDVSGEGTAVETKGNNLKKQKDLYVIVVGSPERLDEVEHAIHNVDSEICRALGKDYSESAAIVRSVYKVQSGLAVNLVKAVMEGKENEPDKGQEKSVTALGTVRIGNVDVTPSSPEMTGDQVVVLNGVESEVKRLLLTMKDLDSYGIATSEFESYDVKFVDPRALREDLVSMIPGIRVSIPPASAGNQKVYQEGGVTKQLSAANGSDDKNSGSSSQNDSNSSATSSSQSSGSQSSGGGSDKDTSQLSGITNTYAGLEANAVPMRLILRGSREQINNALSYLNKVDVPARQVALELRVMELNKEDAISAGIDWNLFTGGAVKFIKMNNGVSDANTSIGVDLDHGINGDVTVTLDKIATKSNLIARPNLLAMDGRETDLFIGDVIRYIESIISSQNGVTVTTGSVKVGVQLSVLPRIGGDGSITLDLRPVVSFLRGFKQVPQIGGELPQTSERVAQTTVNILNGETIAIGGLIQDQDRKDVQGVPLLMDLPIVGQLFRRTTTTRTRTELVVFLTVREVDGPASANNGRLPMQDSGKNLSNSGGGK